MAGLYIHIPFCSTKCSYCDFYSMPPKGRIENLVDALLCEFNHRRHEINEAINTIYIGGGTPSLLSDTALERLISGLGLSGLEEFTIEANPDDVSPERVARWRNFCINRVSMGIQSFDDRQLKAIGRRHNSIQAVQAIEHLLNGDISNISCDLIYGLPGQSMDSWADSLKRMLDFRLPHISAYCLSYEPGTRLYAAMTAGRIIPTDDNTLRQMYDHLCSATAAACYEHYEISNFAKQGFRARHNSSYWDSTPYLGLGPGAHSFDGKTRRYNQHNLNAYLKSPDTFTTIDCETDMERFNDLMITALRTSDGFDIQTLPTAQQAELLESAKSWIESQDLSLKNGRLTIPEPSWFISDAILRDLIVV